MSETILPFRIPGGSAGHNFVRMDGVNSMRGDTVRAELVIIQGGPVFLWTGRRDSDSALASALNSEPIDFDLAADLNNDESAELPVGEVTVYTNSAAAIDTIGFLRVIT